jgi:hypothetical protein
MSSLASLRADVRRDLHDEDATAYRWTDNEVDRHIKRALREYSLVNPLEQKTTLTTTSNTRDVSIASLTPRLRVVAAEYPTGDYPPSFVPFSVWGDTLTLDLAGAPSGAQNVNVYWHTVHAINGSVTFPSTHDDIMSGGAAGYAALEWASFASNRVNVGGSDAWGRYMDFANVRLDAFRKALRDLPAANALRSGQLYTAQATRLHSQMTDPGPV